MIKNVVFDLGGVVIGRDYEKYGHEIGEFSFLNGDRQFPDYWIKYDRGLMTREKVIKAIASESALSEREAEVKLDRLMYLFNEFHDTVDLIGELSDAGYGIYVLSNMPAEFIDYVSRFAVFRFFRGMVISSREKMAKPEPRFFGLLTERFGIVPSETLFVDDKPSNIRAGEALGFKTHCFVPGRESCDAIRKILREESLM